MLLGVLGAVFVLAALADRSATVTVALARTTIAPGQAVAPGDVSWVRVHADSGIAARGLLGALEPGEVAAVRIPAGAVITNAELSFASASVGLGSMSISVSVSQADGGDIAPGDRVDVIGYGPGGAHYVATDLEVLAVAAGQRGGVFGAGGAGAYWVSVAVDRPTALAIATAEANTSAGGGGALQVVRSTGEGPGPSPPAGTNAAASPSGAGQ